MHFVSKLYLLLFGFAAVVTLVWIAVFVLGAIYLAQHVF
jgi:hypothetical protein